jgi:hypothetical protein
MKKLLLFALVLLAAPVVAQETYSVPANAGQVADLTSIVDAVNGRTCEAQALSTACTQAQACVSANAAGGASCTAAQARAANVRIYPNTQAGREEYVQFKIALAKFNELKADIVARGLQRLCQFWATANQTQKDALCTGSGQTAGCLLCP